MPRSSRRAFTLIELLALLGITAILLAIFLPLLADERERDRRAHCEDNLRQLREALQHYALDDANHHDYPRAVYDPAVNPNGYTAFTGALGGGPFSPSVGPNDVTASLWILVHVGYITDLKLFICPSTADRADDPPAALLRPNFRTGSNLSYSYADPFSGYADYRLNSDQLPGQFVLLADKNPGPAAAAVPHDARPLDLARANSLNHHRAGQNVLYADGSVTFESTPYCGIGRDPTHANGDNIFTALAPQPLKPGESPYYAGNGFCGRQFGPSYQYDSYLVPTEEDGR